MSESTASEERESVLILLVDDNPAFLRAATKFLEEAEAGFVVRRASSGEEAVRLARDTQPRLVLLDVNMPGLSGLQTLPLLRDVLPSRARIIVLTLHASQALCQEVLAAGGDDCLDKARLDSDLLPISQRHLAPEGARPVVAPPPLAVSDAAPAEMTVVPPEPPVDEPSHSDPDTPRPAGAGAVDG